MTMAQIFTEALLASQRAPEIPETEDLFGWLVGSWEIEASLHGEDGHIEQRRGEVHASWVLEGRAIQDLFIFPSRQERQAGAASPGDRYATTIRTFDNFLGAWHVSFINPAAEETNAQLIARRDGDGILMEGRLSDQTPVRWRYGGVTANAFHYSAEKWNSDGTAWEIYLELSGKRSGAA